jgi:hypothetical protein
VASTLTGVASDQHFASIAALFSPYVARVQHDEPIKHQAETTVEAIACPQM